ncbi:MAG: DNA topoisomerase I [Planctomyces sp.]|nr:DNA topoisomerase I [Planctomyces sp.]
MPASLFRGLVAPLLEPVVKPVLRPITRLLVGLIAIPMFRLFRRRVVRVQEMNEELERDIDQWFRGAVLLLIATSNMEPVLFPWAEKIARWQGESIYIDNWITLALRLMLAIGVIEGMPDQTLFAIIHPGIRRVRFEKGVGFLRNLWRQKKAIGLGIVCQHLNRSSPVFAILSTLLEGPLGWTFYGLAIAQYLIIGLVTSQDRAKEVLSEFDLRVAERRRELLHELDLPEDMPVDPAPKPALADPPPAGSVAEAVLNPAATTLEPRE